MTLAQARTLVAVIEQGSFTRAALELDLSQAAVSSGVRELERELGVRLLERGRFGARPTTVGGRVAAEARAMLEAERTIRQLAEAARGRVAGRLRVAVFHSVGSYVVPNALSVLAGRFPDVQVELVEPPTPDPRSPPRHFSYDMLDTLRDRGAGVAFLQLPLPAQGEPLGEVLLWELLQDDFVALVAPALLARLGATTLARRHLLEAPLLTNGDTTCGSMAVEHVRATIGTPLSVQSIRDDVAIARMAERGLGIGLLPRLAVDGAPGLELFPMEPRLTRTIAVAVRADGLRVPTVRAFLWALAELYPDASLPGAPLEWDGDGGAAPGTAVGARAV